LPCQDLSLFDGESTPNSVTFLCEDGVAKALRLNWANTETDVDGESLFGGCGVCVPIGINGVVLPARCVLHPRHVVFSHALSIDE